MRAHVRHFTLTSTPTPVTWRAHVLRLLQPEFYYYYRSEIAFCLALGAISVAIHWLQNIQYPVFHTIVSIFYITVSCFFYLLSLGTLSWSENMLIHLFGVVYLYSAIITGMHMLAYPGMHLLQVDESNVATQLYIAMRYFHSIGFTAALAFVVWRTRRLSHLDDLMVSKRVGDREDSDAGTAAVVQTSVPSVKPQQLVRSQPHQQNGIQLTENHRENKANNNIDQHSNHLRVNPHASESHKPHVNLKIATPVEVPLASPTQQGPVTQMVEQPLIPMSPDLHSSVASPVSPQIPTLSELQFRPSFKRQASDSQQQFVKPNKGETTTAYWNYPRSQAIHENRDGDSVSNNSSKTERIIQLKPENEVKGISGCDMLIYRGSHLLGIIYTVLHALFIFLRPIYPNCFETPSGLTWFKKGSEFAIVFLYLVSLAILVKYHHDIFPKSLDFKDKDLSEIEEEQRHKKQAKKWMRNPSAQHQSTERLEDAVSSDEENDLMEEEQTPKSRWQTNTQIQPVPWIIGGLVLNIAAELCFTVYNSPVAQANLIGHLFEFCATAMLSRGMFEAVFKSPLVILFKSVNLKHMKLKETLSELKVAHHQLKSRMKLAGTAQFQALMQHEIRTPMNGLLGLSELLLEEVKVVDPTNYHQQQQQRHQVQLHDRERKLYPKFSDDEGTSSTQSGNLGGTQPQPAANTTMKAVTNSLAYRGEKKSLSQNNSPSSASRSLHQSTPSTSYTSVPQPESYLTPDHRSMLSTIHYCAGQLLSVLNGVLDIASIDAHMLHLESIPVDLAKLASRVIKLNEPAANAKQIKLSMSISGDKGKLSGNESVFLADPHRLNQIFTQFVSNGIKFGKEGGCVHLSIQLLELIAARSPQSKSRLLQDANGASTGMSLRQVRHIRFEVTDCCEGIREDRLGSMFEPFASSAGGDMQNLLVRPTLHGLGLGLTLCKHLIQHMHGSIGCMNNPHAPGCIFYADVFLPIPLTKDFASVVDAREYVSPMAIDLPSPMRLAHFSTVFEPQLDSHTPVLNTNRSIEESCIGEGADGSYDSVGGSTHGLTPARNTPKAWAAAPVTDGSIDSQQMLLSQLEHIHAGKLNHNNNAKDHSTVTIHPDVKTGTDAVSSFTSGNIIGTNTMESSSIDSNVNPRFDNKTVSRAVVIESSSTSSLISTTAVAVNAVSVAVSVPSPQHPTVSWNRSPTPVGSAPVTARAVKPELTRAHSNPLQHSPVPASRVIQTQSGVSVHVLVVDDSSVNRRVLCHMLKHVCMELGWQVSVHIAENGQEGLDRYKQSLIEETELHTSHATESLPNTVSVRSPTLHPKENTASSSKKQSSIKHGLYDLVFMDLMMPVMDGITCTKMIRQLECEQARAMKESTSDAMSSINRSAVRLPIIALTAMVTVEGVEESAGASLNSPSGPSDAFSTLPSLPVALFDEKILKPINKQQLKNLLIAIKTTNNGQNLLAENSVSKKIRDSNRGDAHSRNNQRRNEADD